MQHSTTDTTDHPQKPQPVGAYYPDSNAVAAGGNATTDATGINNNSNSANATAASWTNDSHQYTNSYAQDGSSKQQYSHVNAANAAASNDNPDTAASSPPDTPLVKIMQQQQQQHALPAINTNPSMPPQPTPPLSAASHNLGHATADGWRPYTGYQRQNSYFGVPTSPPGAFDTVAAAAAAAAAAAGSPYSPHPGMPGQYAMATAAAAAAATRAPPYPAASMMLGRINSMGMPGAPGVPPVISAATPPGNGMSGPSTPTRTLSGGLPRVNSHGQSSTSQRKRYLCTVCQKMFARPSTLATHMHSHTGEKPYECTWDSCGKRFSVMSNLRRHQRIHERQRAKFASMQQGGSGQQSQGAGSQGESSSDSGSATPLAVSTGLMIHSAVAPGTPTVSGTSPGTPLAHHMLPPPPPLTPSMANPGSSIDMQTPLAHHSTGHAPHQPHILAPHPHQPQLPLPDMLASKHGMTPGMIHDSTGASLSAVAVAAAAAAAMAGVTPMSSESMSTSGISTASTATLNPATPPNGLKE
ncbi:hypothetical protein GGI12_004694 [Dipsacomyces acuminosporus]|nr:hypothetical protein GGI12_004694 [Dipsacomyces acuminosporus]